jgi:hypothetical protein
MPRPAKSPLPQPLFHEPVFNEIDKTPDPTGFKTPPNKKMDDALYKKYRSLLTKDVVSFSKKKGTPGDLLALADAYGPHGPDVVKQIQNAGHVVFHSVGDSGASGLKSFPSELHVADHVTDDCRNSPANDRPAFLFHLGDLVYNFGESIHYYDQFYEPFRNYPAPIFAIPGNHDSFIIPGTPAAQTPLTTFTRNFCSPTPVITKEAGSLHRTAMTQPGVYFTLDAPFVRIIGLFSNALEDPGVISSEKENKKKSWSKVPDFQLDYLTAQLNNIKQQNYKGAVLLAAHHPPFSYAPKPTSGGRGGNHGGSPNMLREIDAICKQANVYPHAFISGHAHNYQRFTRAIRFGGSDFQVPFVVCGNSGHNANHLVMGSHGQPGQDPPKGQDVDVGYMDNNQTVDARGLVLKNYEDAHFGYLRISVDNTKLAITFNAIPRIGSMPGPTPGPDVVTVDLATHKIV